MARELRQRNDSQGDKVHCSERTRSMAESWSPNESEWLHRLSMLYVCPNRSFVFVFCFLSFVQGCDDYSLSINTDMLEPK